MRNLSQRACLGAGATVLALWFATVPWGGVLASPLAGAQQAAATVSFPEAEPSHLWISSIPPGLECYLAKAGTTSSPDQVFARANRKGVTPLLVEPPGPRDPPPDPDEHDAGHEASA